jgi:septal ring factor EnvC (AmiA/AmiB activator)
MADEINEKIKEVKREISLTEREIKKFDVEIVHFKAERRKARKRLDKLEDIIKDLKKGKI